MVEKLEAIGGSGGRVWDDGSSYSGIRKVSFMLHNNEIRQIRIDYDKGGVVETGEHGESTGKLEEFVVDYPAEYIIYVEGTCDIVSNPALNRVRSLTIKTSKGRTSSVFGNPAAKSFILESHGSALVGFHGRAVSALDAIGAYFSPSPPPSYIRLDYQGGSGGCIWDSGPNYNGIRKVSLMLLNNEIKLIKFDYDKGGVVETVEHGENVGQQAEFVVNYPVEYIISVEGTCDIVNNPVQNRVRSMTIQTSKGRTSPIFGNASAHKFVLKSHGNAIIGFHGRAASALDAIGAYFSPSPPPPYTKSDYQGGCGGRLWDDGPNYNGIRKVSFMLLNNEIRLIRVDYDKGGVVETVEHGENLGQQMEFVVDYPAEYIISVEGTCDIVSDPIQNRVRSLTFKTSKGRTSPVFGNPAARKFLFESHGSALVGFHGRAASAVDAIGAYFSASPSIPITGKKLKAIGGEEGALWDDGVFEGVRKIHVGQNHDGVSFVKIEYNKGSQVIIGDGHGKKSLLGVETFELDYPSEYITTMGVNYDNIHGDKGGVTLVTSLIFKTNKRTSQPFGLGGGQYVERKEEGHKIVGFHGKTAENVHQIGVYVAPITN